MFEESGRKLKLWLVGGLCVLGALAMCAPAAISAPALQPTIVVGLPGPPICPEVGEPISGTFTHSITLHGNSYVAEGENLSVKGSLTIAPGACLDAFTLGTVDVTGNVRVGRGAILALGCSPGWAGIENPQPPCEEERTEDVVGGSIFANEALTMYLSGDYIRGNVISERGGPGPVFEPYVNYPIKENMIGGSLIVYGWRGAWLGALRNVILGNVVFSNNVTANEDSTEIATNAISGNLLCSGNVPAAQLGDSEGLPNEVRGRKLGQCAGL